MDTLLWCRRATILTIANWTQPRETRLMIHDEVVLSSPFCALRQSRSTVKDDMPRVLLVSPLSGHRLALLSDTVRDLSPGHQVLTTDWADAADVPRGRLGEGRRHCRSPKLVYFWLKKASSGFELA